VFAYGCVTAGAKGQVEVLGNFSSIKHINEDAFGCVLQLWKTENHIFGLLSVYTGEPADPPVGILEDTRFDPRTGRLSFSVRLSTGLVYSRAYAGVPSRDRFTFEGRITRRQVSGILTTSNELFPEERPGHERLRLRWSKSLTQLMVPPPLTYSDWKTWADEILERRGPKW
jgi:hypothetical protein